MAKKKELAEGEEAPTKKGKSNLIPAVVVAAGLLGGGYFMSGGGGAKATPAAAATTGSTTSTTSEVVVGEISKLDSVTINLADGRYVKVGLAMQLKEGVKAEAFANQAPRALDFAIDIFGNRTYPQLITPAGRDQAKNELQEKVVAAYGGKVTAVYFTEFVMQ